MIRRKKKVTVIGAGGHAKVVISTLQAAGFLIHGVFDDDAAKWGQKILGASVVGSIDSLKNKWLGYCISAIGSNHHRKTISERLNADWITVIHPKAYVHSSVKLGQGTVVFAGAIIQPEVELGKHVIVNTGVTIDHEVKISNFAHLAPGTHLAGQVSVSEGALLGIGSAVVPNTHIGSWTTVGAGAVVLRNVPDNAVSVGIPAQILRKR